MWHQFHSIHCKLIDKYILSVILKAKNSPQWMSQKYKQKAWLNTKEHYILQIIQIKYYVEMSVLQL